MGGAIVLRNVTKTFGGIVAVRDLELVVVEGGTLQAGDLGARLGASVRDNGEMPVAKP